MLRNALFRSAPRAAIAAARPVVCRRTLVTAAAKPTVAAMVPRLHSLRVAGVRMYSAGGALNKEEVEGRIISLLEGFDKVSSLPAVMFSLPIRAGSEWSEMRDAIGDEAASTGDRGAEANWFRTRSQSLPWIDRLFSCTP
jgi:hypothetical protein